MTPAELRKLIEGATAGPWQLQDGCSWRRIGTTFHDGDVLCPTNSRTDGHPDLSSSDGKLYANLRLIVAAVNALPHLLDEIEELKRERDEAIESRQAGSINQSRYLRMAAGMQREIDAASSRANAAEARIVELVAALEPFGDFGAREVDDDGWKNPPMRERVVDWFGPSDFRRARTALEGR